MRRLFLTLFVIVVSCLSLVAQTVVNGSVVNEAKEPLQGSTVLFAKSDSIVGGAVTDGKGRFQLKGLPAGEYECRVSLLGYKPTSRRFTLTDKTRLSQFILEEDAKSLDELTVVADASQRTKELAGMSVYYLSDRARKEPDAYLALREIPRLRVNTVNRSITLDNGTSPLILVNGVRKPLDVISPELIESVEVIDNPSARYLGDSSVSSVLNLKLKKEGIKPYLYGDLGVKTTPNANFIYSHASFEMGTTTSSLYINGGYMQTDKSRFENYSDTYQGNLHREQSGETKGSWRNPFVQIGGDKVISKKDYIAFGVKYFPNPRNSHRRSEGEITDLSTGESSILESEYESRTRFHEVLGNLYYKHTFKTGRTLEISGDYFFSISGNKARREENSKLYSYVNHIDLDNSRHMGKLDAVYSDMLTKSTQLQLGSNTEYSVTDIDDRLDSWPNFRYRRTREYLFAGLDNNRSTGRFNYVASLGLDMVFSDAAGATHSYIDVIPSVSLSYNFAKHQNLSLLYKRSRTMPSAGNLNPRNTSTDSLSVTIGNPMLTPTHTDMVKFGYTFSNGKIRLNPYLQYSHISDIILPYGYLDGDIYVNSYQNLGHTGEFQTGVTFNYNLPQGKVYYGGVSLDAHYRKEYMKGMSFSGRGFGASVMGYFGYKSLSVTGYVGISPSNFTYSLYSKTKNNLSSNFAIEWSVNNSLRLNVTAEQYLCPKKPSKTWTLNGDYHSFSSSVPLTMAPKVCVGVWYTFSTNNFRWRNKKQFSKEDSELKSITSK